MYYDNVNMWSDRWASQFRSKYVFFLVAETMFPSKKLSWHYNERHHVKGSMDGLRSILKRKVFSALKSGNVVVNDPKESLESK